MSFMEDLHFEVLSEGRVCQGCSFMVLDEEDDLRGCTVGMVSDCPGVQTLINGMSDEDHQ